MANSYEKKQTSQPSGAGKAPPQSEQLEKSVLGILMISKGAILKVHGIISEDTFYFEYHQVIYKAMLNLFAADTPIDPVMLVVELHKMGKMNGDTITESYIDKLTRGVVSDSELEVWIRKLEEYAIARRNIQIHMEAIGRYYQNEEDVFEIANDTDTKLFASRNSLDAYKNISPARIGEDAWEQMERAMQMKGITGAPTGVPALDDMIGGWQPSTVNTIAARTRHGKSAIAAAFMYKHAQAGFPTAFCSMEMSDVELMFRLWSMHLKEAYDTTIPYSDIFKGRVTEHQKGLIKDAKYDVGRMGIYIDDTPALNPLQLKSKALKLINDHDVKVIYVDYIQLMDKHMKIFGGNGAEALSQNMRDLKKIAKTLKIPVNPLSQVDRLTEKGPGSTGRARLADVKGSGGIEDNSDTLTLLYRPEVMDPDAVDQDTGLSERGIMYIDVVKHKMGETGLIKTPFDVSTNSFTERDYSHEKLPDLRKYFDFNKRTSDKPDDDDSPF